MTDLSYKLLGEIDEVGGVGVFGRNTSTSGETKGVEGAVDSSEGYGLYTDDDAYVGGTLATGEQNNNEISLTRLVNDGQYADIADAIANAPPNYPTGVRFVIEPGNYTASGPYTITWDNKEIVAYGYGDEFTSGPDPAVTIQSTSSRLFQVGDPSNNVKSRGGRFVGIKFKPETVGSGSEAFFFAGTGSSDFTRNFSFERCAFYKWGGPGVDVDSELQNFGHVFRDCGFQANQGTANFGKQSQHFGGTYVTNNTSGPGFRFPPASHVSGTEFLTGSDGLTAAHVAGNVNFIPQSMENANGSEGSIAVLFEGAWNRDNNSIIAGRIQGWETGVKIAKGAPTIMAGFQNISGDQIRVSADTNEANGTIGIGNYRPDKITVEDDQMGMRFISTQTQVNAIADDIPLGWEGFDVDRGGTGTPAMLYGGDVLDDSVSYWDRDGTL